MGEYDVVIIGSGHNGLVCAGYLARAGFKTLVLERRDIVGGCVTTEVMIPDLPEFKFSPCGVEHIWMMPNPAIKDLQLGRFGLEYVYEDPAFFAPSPGKAYALFWRSVEKTCEEIGRFSAKDARAYREFIGFWSDAIDVINELFFLAPLPVSELSDTLRGPKWRLLPKALKALLKKKNRTMCGSMLEAGAMKAVNGETLLQMLLMSASGLLHEWFEGEFLKVPMAIGGAQLGSPSNYGSGMFAAFMAYIHKQGLAHPKGGSGMLTAALARAVEHYGGTVRTDAEVASIIVDGNRARGVVLTDGEEILANKSVVSNAHAKVVFRNFLKEGDVPRALYDRVMKLRIANSIAGINVFFALDEPPYFEKWGARPEFLKASLLLCSSVSNIEKCCFESQFGILPEEYALYNICEAAFDPSLAPPGKFGLRAYSPAPYALANGEKWEDIKEREADRIMEQITRYAPNFKRSVIGRYVESPVDLERRTGNPKGHFYHLDMTIDQMFGFRPLPELSQYRTPIPGLYLTGAGTHPMGGITGIPGHNTAHAVMEDLG